VRKGTIIRKRCKGNVSNKESPSGINPKTNTFRIFSVSIEEIRRLFKILLMRLI
jgi:hypothetical protein